MVKIAYQHGVNFYDTAEIYGNGQAEELLGGAIKKGIAEDLWSREDLVISTKVFSGYKGLTTWSPLAFGTLTGKYSDGKPEGSRYTAPMFKEGSPLAEGF
ncbi:hypothetical protein PR003_g34119, partial [Phytophthora rubi]